jgi:hypothetical protein
VGETKDGDPDFDPLGVGKMWLHTFTTGHDDQSSRTTEVLLHPHEREKKKERERVVVGSDSDADTDTLESGIPKKNSVCGTRDENWHSYSQNTVSFSVFLSLAATCYSSKFTQR